MPFLICVKCDPGCSIETHNKKFRPSICGPDEAGYLCVPRWLEPPALKKQNPFVDPMGEEYQTPIMDPVSIPKRIQEREHDYHNKPKYIVCD